MMIDDIANKMISIKDLFGFESDLKVRGFDAPNEYVPEINPNYHFDKTTTLSILAGFSHNQRVLVQGLHGTGKSSHIEQVAARLNWPCIRVNLDGNISRLDLIGKDTLKIQAGKQVTQFELGIVPWALQRPIALVFDEYDAGRPEVMFIIQRLLEQEGKFTLLDQNKTIKQHPNFRLFATANTLGLGNIHNLYHGTHLLNHAQLDRWNIVASLNFLSPTDEAKIITAHVPELSAKNHSETLKGMIALANLTRDSLKMGDLSNLMSPRTLISWAQNFLIFKDLQFAFRLSFLNKCDESERALIAELYQRVFGQELEESLIHLNSDE